MNLQSKPALGLRAIVAEDDPEMRALLAEALVKEGFSVTSVADGLELIEEIERLSPALALELSGLPHLVVSDVQMPRCTGLTALAALKRMKLLAPVVLITAFGDEYTHDEALRLGAAAVLDKPLDLADLRSLAVTLVC